MIEMPIIFTLVKRLIRRVIWGAAYGYGRIRWYPLNHVTKHCHFRKC
jgi:hypothetical protein